MPPKSTVRDASSPTVHASCPGAIEKTSPGPSSPSVPSSIMTFIRPERTWPRWMLGRESRLGWVACAAGCGKAIEDLGELGGAGQHRRVAAVERDRLHSEFRSD